MEIIMSFWILIYSSALILIGILLNKYFESRPKLVAFFSAVSAGRVVVEAAEHPVGINSHTIVIVNKGSRAAANVRVGHRPVFPSVRNVVAIFPQQNFDTRMIPGTGEEIVFERILPKQSISITYIYDSHITVRDINTYVRSDEAEAKFWPVEMQRKFPFWYLMILLGLMLLGGATLLYFLWHYGPMVFSYFKELHS